MALLLKAYMNAWDLTWLLIRYTCRKGMQFLIYTVVFRKTCLVNNYELAELCCRINFSRRNVEIMWFVMQFICKDLSYKTVGKLDLILLHRPWTSCSEWCSSWLRLIRTPRKRNWRPSPISDAAQCSYICKSWMQEQCGRHWQCKCKCLLPDVNWLTVGGLT